MDSIWLQVGIVVCGILITLGMLFFVLFDETKEDGEYNPYEPQLPEDDSKET